MSQTDIHENIISDLEANNPEINKKMDEISVQLQQPISILKKEQKDNNDIIIIRCVKIFGVITLIVLLAPLSIISLYYAYTDNSCVHTRAGQLSVDLFTYLAVDGILGGVGIIIWSILICNTGPDVDINPIIHGCNIFLIIIGQLFQLAWTIVGSVIFWGLIDNKTCDKGIYDYVFALLVIKYAIMFINIICNKNDKK